MSSVKVSALSAKTSPSGSEELLINDGGTSKKITIDNVTENNFTDTLKSKLDAIEASADVTDTTNVTSAGALMDSEVTNLAQVKAFDTTDYATSTQGTTADNALPKAGGTMTGDVSLGDNVKARFGASDDLQIYHDGSNSYIKDAGTGSLRLRGTDLRLESSTLVHNFIVCSEGGGVSVFHNDSSKLATTSTGVNVTGTVNGLEINTTATSNLGLGTGAVDSITTGDYNVGVGDNALTANTTGNYNTADGYQALYSNTTGGSNTAIGYAALAASTTGYRNTAVGHLAGTALTTGLNNVAVGKDAMVALTTGSGNVAVGKEALDAITTGSNTVAIGTAALSANTSGTSNTAVGHGVLAANTTGGENVAMGYAALDANTTASNNVGIGYFALSANTTGANNTASGYQSLYSNTTGSYNTASGYSALYANTTGYQNTAVGYQCLDACTTGIKNSAMGIGAATSLTTGDQNTAVGRSALQEVTTGDKNTAIGNDAGSALTTGSHNVMIGNESGNSGSPGGLITTASNTLCMGANEISVAHIQVDWTIASDKRDKTDIEPMEMGLSFINQLEPVTYRWDKRAKYINKLDPTVDLNTVTTDGTHKESWLDVGFLAQDVEELEAQYGYKIEDETNLTTNLSEDGKQYGLTYNKFTPMLVKAIQELTAKVEALEAQLNA